MDKIKITNRSQFEKLVEEMEKNPPLAKGFRRGTVPSDFKEQWERIATALNSRGPPMRTGDGWQKIWRDLKFKVKRKMVTYNAECKATQGGILKQLILSKLEVAVANLLQFQKQLNPEGMVQGVPNTECELLLQSEDTVDLNLFKSLKMERAPTTSSKAAAQSTATLPSTEQSTAPSTAPYTTPSTTTTNSQNPLRTKLNFATKKNENPVKRHELLERHSIDQARILTEISNSMKSIKRSVRDVKEIEAKRLKLELKRNEREEAMYLTDMKIKRIKVLIKETELQSLLFNFN